MILLKWNWYYIHYYHILVFIINILLTISADFQKKFQCFVFLALRGMDIHVIAGKETLSKMSTLEGNAPKEQILSF